MEARAEGGEGWGRSVGGGQVGGRGGGYSAMDHEAGLGCKC